MSVYVKARFKSWKSWIFWAVCAIFSSLQSDVTKEIEPSKTAKFLLGKTLWTHTFLAKFQVFLQNYYFGTSGSNVQRQVKLFCSFNTQRLYFNSLIREWKAYVCHLHLLNFNDIWPSTEVLVLTFDDFLSCIL